MSSSAGSQVPPSPPASRAVGVGCTLTSRGNGDIVIQKVIPGSPAAFSCKLAVDDQLLRIDGWNVAGSSHEEVSRRITGPEGTSVRISYRIRKLYQGQTVIHSDEEIILIRQKSVAIPDRLCEGPMGLGVDPLPVDGQGIMVRSLRNGGAAELAGGLQLHDVIVRINDRDVRCLDPGADLG
eukprot:CAMPEP_0113714802 /NCGR_PEP_ID=MMETSP0038_2-20120614/32849_1 /TAXON_ID=2898 /ORGANISM="Cryptomonas paramecium" /LENGTH=180 /DNA_ID=CAMNT_0000641879 /DNA_START=247 /DNA_END=785 /DNA_ORIENTATION=+ /assembly_acc=CAM_ASM_000170